LLSLGGALGSRSETPPTSPTSLPTALQREIAVLRRLAGHPHIIQLLDVVEQSQHDRVALVFPECPRGCIIHVDVGLTVPPLDGDTAQRYFRQLASAVDHSTRDGAG